MHTFDVVVWPGELSDGSTCYAAWCSYVLGIWAQADTEAEALESITAMMVDVIEHPWDDGLSLADPEEARAEMDRVMEDLSGEGIAYRVHQVSVPSGQPVGV